MQASYTDLTTILPVSFIECGESLAMSLSDVYCRRPVWRSELTSTPWNRKDFSRLHHLSSCLFHGSDSLLWRTRNHITLIRKAIILIPQFYFQVQRWLYSLLQKLFQIFKASSNICTKTAFPGCPKFCSLFPWVTLTGECQSSEGNRIHFSRGTPTALPNQKCRSYWRFPLRCLMVFSTR